MNRNARVILAAFAVATPALGQSTALGQSADSPRKPAAVSATPATPGSNSSGTVVSPSADDVRTRQVQAATVIARSRLKDQVRKTFVNKTLSVGDVIDQTHSGEDLDKAIGSADPVGGPRWTDDHTCQVRVELPGESLSDLMTSIQKAHPADFPVKADDLQHRITSWGKTRFSTVGTAVGADQLEQARSFGPGWTDVPDAERRRTVTEARSKATAQTLDALGPIRLTTTETIADALKKPAVRDRVVNWLDHQPVTRIERSEDLKVSITISFATHTLSGVVQSAVHDADPNQKGIDWEAAGKLIEAIPSSATGTATATAPAKPAAPVANSTASNLSEIPLPPQPSDIGMDLLEAEATAPAGASKLKTKGAAEAAAVQKVRAEFLALHVSQGKTLADAVTADPALEKAVDRAMLRARAYKVDYAADGSVTVKVQLDPQAAWDDLRATP